MWRSARTAQNFNARVKTGHCSARRHEHVLLCEIAQHGVAAVIAGRSGGGGRWLDAAARAADPVLAFSALRAGGFASGAMPSVALAVCAAGRNRSNSARARVGIFASAVDSHSFHVVWEARKFHKLIALRFLDPKQGTRSGADAVIDQVQAHKGALKSRCSFTIFFHHRSRETPSYPLSITQQSDLRGQCSASRRRRNPYGISTGRRRSRCSTTSPGPTPPSASPLRRTRTTHITVRLALRLWCDVRERRRLLIWRERWTGLVVSLFAL